VVARHADALLGPAATAVAGVGGDTAVLAVALFFAVAAPQGAGGIPLHHARHAAAPAGAGPVGALVVLENVRRRQHFADRQLGQRGRQPELLDEPLRLAVRLGQQRDAGGGPLAAALRFQLARHVATLRAGGLVAGFIEEAELHGVVAVF